MKKLLSFLALIVSVLAVFAITYTNNADAAIPGSIAVYKVTSKSAVTASNAPEGTSATYSSTYNTTAQLTAGNSMTLTLSGYDGLKITGVTLSMKSNSSKGKGSMSITVGANKVQSTSDSAFNTSSWNGAWSTSYVDIERDITDTTVGSGEKIVITISASANSLYCQSFTIHYESSVPASTQLSELVSKYRNNGVYTKKSQIFLNTESIAEVSKYFHGNVANQERTTYYKGEYLLMGDYTGGFDRINSGYRTDGSNMKHFTYLNGEVVDDYTVKNTTLHDFYVTLNKMVEDDYFNEWSGFSYEFDDNASAKNDPYLADFLAFAAPCLLNTIFNYKDPTAGEDASNYFILKELVIKEGSCTTQDGTTRKYLAFQIYVSSTNSGALTSSVTGDTCLLAESRVYAGNECFDENFYHSISLKNNNPELGTVTCDTDLTNKLLKGTDVVFTLDFNEDLINYSISVPGLTPKVENNQFTVSAAQDRKVTVTFTKKIDDDKAGLSIATEITDTLDLPQNGAYGSTITWSSSNSNIIEIKENNAVIKQSDKEETVRLTATLVLGNDTVTKPFDVKVAASGQVLETTATLSFASISQRTSFSNTQQIWEQAGITFTNDKASSTNAVANYSNPVRLYAKSSITITAVGSITKIIFDCNSGTYAKDLNSSIGTVEGATVSVSNDIVTVTFTNAVESFKISSLTAQVRIDSITVTSVQ